MDVTLRLPDVERHLRRLRLLADRAGAQAVRGRLRSRRLEVLDVRGAGRRRRQRLTG